MRLNIVEGLNIVLECKSMYDFGIENQFDVSFSRQIVTKLAKNYDGGLNRTADEMCRGAEICFSAVYK